MFTVLRPTYALGSTLRLSSGESCWNNIEPSKVRVKCIAKEYPTGDNAIQERDDLSNAIMRRLASELVRFM